MLKVALQSSEKKTSFSMNGVKTIRYLYGKKMKLDLSSHHENI